MRLVGVLKVLDYATRLWTATLLVTAERHVSCNINTGSRDTRHASSQSVGSRSNAAVIMRAMNV